MLQRISEGLRVTVKTSEIINMLNKHRDDHAKEYRDAVVGFHTKALEMLNEAIANVGEDVVVGDVRISLTAPVDNTEEYSKLIRMFSSNEEDTVELSASDWDMIAEDEWQWRSLSKTLNTRYHS